MRKSQRGRSVFANALVFTAVLGVFATASHAQSPASQPIARAELEVDVPIIVGQPVSVRVEVLVPSFFTGAPNWPDVEIHDAMTIFQWTGGLNFTERIDGQTWAGQSRRYVVYPQRARRYEISSIPIEVRYSVDGETVTATVSPAPIGFDAELPPEARGLEYFIATNGLELVQVFDARPDTIRVGEAFRRTLTVTVQNAMGMVVPRLEVRAPAGLGIYRDPPVVEETFGERGSSILGTRVETITYLAEKEGTYSLPAIELVWWDLGAKRLRREMIPPVEFVVSADTNTTLSFSERVGDGSDADGGPASVVPSLRRWGSLALFLGTLFLVLTRFIRRFGPALRERIDAAQRERSQSESAYFERFRKAAQSGDPRAAWSTLTAWLDRTHRGPGAATVRGFVETASDSVLEQQVDAIDRALFGVDPPAQDAKWSGKALARSAARSRRRKRVPSSAENMTSMQLNPGCKGAGSPQ
jgi:hypothetical protein